MIETDRGKPKSEELIREEIDRLSIFLSEEILDDMTSDLSKLLIEDIGRLSKMLYTFPQVPIARQYKVQSEHPVLYDDYLRFLYALKGTDPLEFRRYDEVLTRCEMVSDVLRGLAWLQDPDQIIWDDSP